jgi:hypothetical protein
MKISVLYSTAIVVSLIGGSGAFAQHAAGDDTAAKSASTVSATASDAAARTPSQNKDTGAAAAPQTGPFDPNADKPPMRAQDLATLVPKDSSQPPVVHIDRVNADNHYRYDKAGVNCSLFPARCGEQNY